MSTIDLSIEDFTCETTIEEAMKRGNWDVVEMLLNNGYKSKSIGMLVNENIQYIGEVKNGMPHGKGRSSYSNGALYEGGWKDGRRHGKRNFTFADGDVYKGKWKYGKKYGQGKYTYSHGERYELNGRINVGIPMIGHHGQMAMFMKTNIRMV